MAHPRRRKLWSYLLGQAGKDVHAGYGEQWTKALEAGIDIIPNPLKGSTPASKWRSAAWLTLDAFCFLV
jgi:hypothetical protein